MRTRTASGGLPEKDCSEESWSNVIKIISNENYNTAIFAKIETNPAIRKGKNAPYTESAIRSGAEISYVSGRKIII